MCVWVEVWGNAFGRDPADGDGAPCWRHSDPLSALIKPSERTSLMVTRAFRKARLPSNQALATVMKRVWGFHRAKVTKQLWDTGVFDSQGPDDRPSTASTVNSAPTCSTVVGSGSRSGRTATGPSSNFNPCCGPWLRGHPPVWVRLRCAAARLVPVEVVGNT